MTRPNDEGGQDAAKWWNDKSKDEMEELEFMQKQMRRAMGEEMGPEEDEEDMGPPDLPEDDDMGPPDIDEDDEMALEPTDREMDSQSRMAMRRETAMRRPRMRGRAKRMMKSGVPRDIASKALRAEMELKRAFSAEKRRDLAKSGMALPDGSFPIVTTEDLKNAIMAFGRAKNKAAAKRHIIKRAKALKKADLIPENWGKKDAKGSMFMCKASGKAVMEACAECKGGCAPMGYKGAPIMCKATGEAVMGPCAECKGGCYPMEMKGGGMPVELLEKFKKKKKISYGEKEAEMEDDEMTSPMSREELMDRIFKKKKKKPMPEDGEEMPEEGEETE